MSPVAIPARRDLTINRYVYFLNFKNDRPMLKALVFTIWFVFIFSQAVACVIYLINKSPTKSVMNRVPKPSWSGMYCNISHLRVFGCVAYAHVPKELRGKLDDKSEKYIFTGYSGK